ncbi:hypothetical protein CAEBREN_02977 [Caenorhabditis brenneri]|uniref:RNA helicase n=1 Tax=Caenorhabditis brenneri TaxID=135651 RepID=G0NAB5_CAEBE|nr:hypothetical protein CAEBREN_02977 [Caenorhabditis brenneri]
MGRDHKEHKEHKRKRSRSKERKRSRSRSPRHRDQRDRDRDRDRDRRRDRDYDRDKRSDRDREKPRDAEKKKEPSKSAVFEMEESTNDIDDILGMKETDLEKEMERRRRNVELWRARKKKDELDLASEAAQDEKAKKNKKSWNLDDEDDEDEFDTLGNQSSSENPAESSNPPPVKVEKMEVDEKDEEDPLDAFMKGISAQNAKKAAQNVPKKSGIVTIVQEEKPEPEKGQLLENEDNMDIVIDDFDIETAAASLCHKGRMLAATDHSKVYYRKFKKNFYIETEEIKKMTKAEVKAYREELDSITVKGIDPPKPIKTWAQCGLNLKMMNVLKKHGYTKPTSIQAQAIPAIMSGRDVIGIAKTGSGKTLAFLLPMFRHILDQPELEEGDGPIAIILAPTRELAMQTYKEANKFAKVLGLRVACTYGGVGISEQIADLKRGAEIVVCTPGRMIDMLAANGGKVTNLRRVTYLVLDEADRMFDKGFEPQIMKVVNNIRPDKQTVLFSATFPRHMDALARKALDKPVEILVGGKSVVCSDVTQNVVICETHQKWLKLLELLGMYYDQGNIIIFVDKQEKADELVMELMKTGYCSVAPLHGGIDQHDRDSSIAEFKKTTSDGLKILVATSVAARGLDVKNLVLVVNYDCPNHYEDYVHRVGRTGRAGRKGYAYTFVLPEHQEKMAGEICRAFETAGCKPPNDLKAMFERFKKEMEAEGKEVKLGGKGFEGHGYKYDEGEAEADANKKKMARLVHGMEAGGDDDDDLDEQLSSMIKTKRRVVHGKPQSDKPTTSGNAKTDREAEKRSAAAKAAAAAISQKLKTASQVIQPVEKTAAQLAAEAVIRGIEVAPVQVSAAMIAQEKANRLNEKLNYLGGEAAPTQQQEEAWEYFEEEWDINDFPQQVRYKICSRESVGHVAELAEVGISVRGVHVPPGKEPKNGERRLHLLLEARSERNLKAAKEEIIRIMKEAFRQLTAQIQRGGAQARYKV